MRKRKKAADVGLRMPDVYYVHFVQTLRQVSNAKLLGVYTGAITAGLMHIHRSGMRRLGRRSPLPDDHLISLFVTRDELSLLQDYFDPSEPIGAMLQEGIDTLNAQSIIEEVTRGLQAGDSDGR